jgi:hypothetical protein
MIHVSEYYRGILPKVVWGACIMGHLRDWDVSQDTIVSHFLDEDVWTGDVLLVIGGADMSELSPYPVAGRYNGADLEVFQENVLELNHLCNVPTGRLSDLDARGCFSGSTTTKCVTLL